MLLTRSLPPQFLLPAWSTQQLAHVVQRAFNSTDSREQQYPTFPIANRSAKRGNLRIRVSDQPDLQLQSSTSNDVPEPDEYVNLIRKVTSDWTDGREKYPNHSRLRRRESGRRAPNAAPAKTASPSTTSKSKMARSEQRKRSEKPSVTLSLFDELFPEERYTKSQEQRLAEQRLDKLPAFNWAPEINIADHAEKKKKESKPDVYCQIPQRDSPAPHSTQYKPVSNVQQIQEGLRHGLKAEELASNRAVSVLVLNACSKNLEESDFFRLSPKGEHIDGWKSGLLKVIPSRDNKTLEVIGSYFLLFSSDAAARAYLDQTMRLHTLTRLTAESKEARFPLPPGYLKEGEDLKNLLRGFSLVPGFNKLSLSMLSRPYNTRVDSLIRHGGPVAIARKKADAEHMVLFTTDRSHTTHADVAEALSQDGKRRNMHWNLAGNKQQAIVKLNYAPRQAFVENVEEEKNKGNFKTNPRTYDGPGRFIISFEDEHEARRFVREWHRRPLPMQRGSRTEDELPPVVNAEILW